MTDVIDRLKKRILIEHGGTADAWVHHWNLTPDDSAMDRDAIAAIERLAGDAERWAKEANLVDDLSSAWAAACAFIDSHVAEPDITAEMVRTYAEFLKWRACIKERFTEPNDKG